MRQKISSSGEAARFPLGAGEAVAETPPFHRFALIVSLVLAACGDPAAGDDSGPASCTPGTQQACACPGGSPPGVQVCAPTGDQFGACMGCEGGDTDASSSGETGSDPSTTATATLTTTDDPSLTTTLGDDSSSTGTPDIPGDG